MDVDAARRDWEDGHRRLERAAAADRRSADRLHAQVEAIAGELRRRVGAHFTLADLAGAYAGAEAWARDAVAEHAATPGWPRTLSIATDAAFHVYARAATDYTP